MVEWQPPLLLVDFDNIGIDPIFAIKTKDTHYYELNLQKRMFTRVVDQCGGYDNPLFLRWDCSIDYNRSSHTKYATF